MFAALRCAEEEDRWLHLMAGPTAVRGGGTVLDRVLVLKVECPDSESLLLAVALILTV